MNEIPGVVWVVCAIPLVVAVVLGVFLATRKPIEPDAFDESGEPLWVDHGAHRVVNVSDRPVPVLTEEQWDEMLRRGPVAEVPPVPVLTEEQWQYMLQRNSHRAPGGPGLAGSARGHAAAVEIYDEDMPDELRAQPPGTTSVAPPRRTVVARRLAQVLVLLVLGGSIVAVALAGVAS